MPSPFPGMDPFLEDPEEFGDLHDSLIFTIRARLQAQLPAGYFARMARRTWVESGGVTVTSGKPDVGVETELLRTDDPRRNGRPAAAVAEPRTRYVVRASGPFELELKENFLEVFQTTRAGTRRLVTSLEVLSPTNKKPGHACQAQFLRKQRELRARGVALVEIDLLRGGRHSTAVPLDRLREVAEPFDYHLCVTLPGRTDRYFVEPFTLRDPLPAVDVPVDDGLVTVDLQAAFAEAYAVGAFAESLVYDPDRVPPPALTEAQRAFVRGRLDQWHADRDA